MIWIAGTAFLAFCFGCAIGSGWNVHLYEMRMEALRQETAAINEQSVILDKAIARYKESLKDQKAAIEYFHNGVAVRLGTSEVAEEIISNLIEEMRNETLGTQL